MINRITWSIAKLLVSSQTIKILVSTTLTIMFINCSDIIKTLRIYHKLQIVPADTMISSLTNNTEELYIDNENTIEEVVEAFSKTYGIKIQIADADDRLLIDEDRKIGNCFKYQKVK